VTIFCIIPARGGSKRIPRKNIKLFNGLPIITYSIRAAMDSEIFDSVIVSTDDTEIASVAIGLGAEVPFFRSEQNSDDFSGTGDVVEEVLGSLARDGRNCDVCCCLYATAPFVTPGALKRAHALFIGSNFDVIFPVVKYPVPVWRGYRMNFSGLLEPLYEELQSKRTQDLADVYYDTGQFYWFNVEEFRSLDNKNYFGIRRGGIIVSELEAHDIDTVDDWTIAEMKYSARAARELRKKPYRRSE